MPLITITCAPEFYPSETGATKDTPSQAWVVRIGQLLTELVAHNTTVLGLEYLRPTDVQVDFKSYHRQAVNTASIWFKFEFYQTPPEEIAKRQAVIRQLHRLIDKAMGLAWQAVAEGWLPPIENGWAIDVVWVVANGGSDDNGNRSYW